MADLRTNVETLMTLMGYHQKSLAMAAGMNPTGVRDILKERVKNPTIKTITALAHTLGVTPETLVDPDITPDDLRAIHANTMKVFHQDVLWWMRRVIDLSGLSQTKWSIKAGVTTRTVSQFIKGEAPIRPQTLEALAAVAPSPLNTNYPRLQDRLARPRGPVPVVEEIDRDMFIAFLTRVYETWKRHDLFDKTDSSTLAEETLDVLDSVVRRRRGDGVSPDQ